MTQNSNDSEDTRDTLIDLVPYADAELAEAMAELDALEAAEKARYSSRTVLRVVALAFLSACMLVPSLASAQDAPAKPKRPTMCLSGQPVSGNGFAGWLCLDGKRPRIFTRYIEVKFTDEAGAPRTYVLGWSAPVKRTAKGGYVAEGTPKGVIKL